LSAAVAVVADSKQAKRLAVVVLAVLSLVRESLVKLRTQSKSERLAQVQRLLPVED
jgi:hypothetical protein